MRSREEIEEEIKKIRKDEENHDIIVSEVKRMHEEISDSYYGEVKRIDSILSDQSLSMRDRQFFEEQKSTLSRQLVKEDESFSMTMDDMFRRQEAREEMLEELSGELDKEDDN